MAWNEPDNDDRKNDDWGAGPRESGNKDQGPPDIDEIIRSLTRKFSGFFGGGKGGFGGGSNGDNGLSHGIVIGIIVIAAIVWVAAGFYTVDEQERGVVLRFGKALDNTVQPGLHWNPPLIDSVNKVNVTRVFDREFSGTMLTIDDNIIDISMTVQYVVTDARAYYLKVRDPDISLQHAAESAIRHVIGDNEMSTALTVGRAQVAQEVRARTQNYMDAYETGITVSQVNIDNAQPPEPVREAFNDVIRAREDNRSFQNEGRRYANQVIPEARGQARRVLEEAQAYKEQVIARAQGDAARFDQLLAEYEKSPQVTRRRLYIESLEQVMSNSSKVLIDTKEGQNNMMLLPLDRMMQQRQQSASGGDGNRGSETGGNLTNQEIQSISNQVIQNIQSRQGNTSPRTGGR